MPATGPIRPKTTGSEGCLPNGDPLIAFEQNRGGTDQQPIRPGMRVRARWTPESSQIIRDERE
jgi:hypothetical protein